MRRGGVERRFSPMNHPPATFALACERKRKNSLLFRSRPAGSRGLSIVKPCLNLVLPPRRAQRPDGDHDPRFVGVLHPRPVRIDDPQS